MTRLAAQAAGSFQAWHRWAEMIDGLRLMRDRGDLIPAADPDTCPLRPASAASLLAYSLGALVPVLLPRVWSLGAGRTGF